MNAKERSLMLVIEDLASHGQALDECHGQKEIGQIYKLAHSFNFPGCSKNHPKWSEELKKAMGYYRFKGNRIEPVSEGK